MSCGIFNSGSSDFIEAQILSFFKFPQISRTPSRTLFWHRVFKGHLTVRPSQCSCSSIPSQYLALLQNGVHSIASDGQWIVSGSGDRTVRIWDLHNATLQCTLKGNIDVVWLVDSCRTGNYLASGSEDGRVALWRYEAA